MSRAVVSIYPSRQHLKQSMNELLAEQWRILFVGDPRVESCHICDAKNRTHQVTPV